MSVHYTAALMSGTGKWLAVALLVAGCGDLADDWFCGDSRCEWTDAEWKRVASLANPPPPPPDRSNVYFDKPDAVGPGQAAVFRHREFSGGVTQKDAIGRDSPPARPPVGPNGETARVVRDLPRPRARGSRRHVRPRARLGRRRLDGRQLADDAQQRLPPGGVLERPHRFAVGAQRRRRGEHDDDERQPAGAGRIASSMSTAADYEAVFGPLDPAIGADVDALSPGRQAQGRAARMTAPGRTMKASDQDTVNRVLVNWGKAIAAYEYQLISIDSPFDAVRHAPARSSTVISGAAKRGARLFVGKAACIDCHNGPQLTDEAVPQHRRSADGRGGADDVAVRRANADRSVCDCVDGPRCAPWGALRRTCGACRATCAARAGCARSTFSDDPAATPRCVSDSRPDVAAARPKRSKGAWRTPSLRNVALTAPYMHDGALATLEDVVWHYNTGGRAATGELRRRSRGAAQADRVCRPTESADLVAFLDRSPAHPSMPRAQAPAMNVVRPRFGLFSACCCRSRCSPAAPPHQRTPRANRSRRSPPATRADRPRRRRGRRPSPPRTSRRPHWASCRKRCASYAAWSRAARRR